MRICTTPNYLWKFSFSAFLVVTFFVDAPIWFYIFCSDDFNAINLKLLLDFKEMSSSSSALNFLTIYYFHYITTFAVKNSLNHTRKYHNFYKIRRHSHVLNSFGQGACSFSYFQLYCNSVHGDTSFIRNILICSLNIFKWNQNQKKWSNSFFNFLIFEWSP